MAGTRRNESAAANASGVSTKRRRSMDWEWLKLSAKIAAVWIAAAALFGWLAGKMIHRGGGNDDDPPMV
jgi:hypothetical protein